MPTLTRKKPSKKINRKSAPRKRSAPKPVAEAVAKPQDNGCGSLNAESTSGGGCGAACGG
jgi:hypothetical protein